MALSLGSLKVIYSKLPHTPPNLHSGRRTKALHCLQTAHFLKYIIGVKVWIVFFNETSILVFANLAMFLSNFE